MIRDEKKKILIVDDDKLSLKVASDILNDEYEVDTVLSGEDSLVYLQENIPDLILMDLHMPGMGGKATISHIMSSPKLCKIPIICLTADSKSETEIQCLSMGAFDYITKPFVPQVTKSRISRVIELNELRNHLEVQLQKKTDLLEQVTVNFIMAIANTIDAKDAYTSGHSLRVAKCAEEIAKALGWNEEQILNIHYIALLHDIGKIGIPDAILNKPSHLTEDEFNVIKMHPVIGHEILKDIRIIEQVSEGALYHHEKYDGTGYPNGLKGEEIPICARIVGIADAYDAMTSNRVYRAKLRDEMVIAEFEKFKGTQFDPELTELFLGMLRNGFSIPATDWMSEYSARDKELNADKDKALSKMLTEYALEARNVAMHDSLTGLYNRSYAESKIPPLLNEEEGGVLFTIDIDDFKDINANYGHIAGDHTLKTLAKELSEFANEGDVVCRVAGDEFILYRKALTDRTEAALVARNIISHLSTKIRENRYSSMTTISVGIGLYPQDGNTYELLFDNADKALYHVKKNGKNAYSFYSDDEKDSIVTTTDIDNIRHVIEGKASDFKGVFHVEYENFRQMYNYVERNVLRNKKQVQTILFTLGVKEAASYRKIVPDEAMNILEAAVASSLRMVDIGTRYSSVQYIAILLDSDEAGGRIVGERVKGKFFQLYVNGDVTLSYDMQTMNPERE